MGEHKPHCERLIFTLIYANWRESDAPPCTCERRRGERRRVDVVPEYLTGDGWKTCPGFNRRQSDRRTDSEVSDGMG